MTDETWEWDPENPDEPFDTASQVWKNPKKTPGFFAGRFFLAGCYITLFLVGFGTEGGGWGSGVVSLEKQLQGVGWVHENRTEFEVGIWKFKRVGGAKLFSETNYSGWVELICFLGVWYPKKCHRMSTEIPAKGEGLEFLHILAMTLGSSKNCIAQVNWSKLGRCWDFFKLAPFPNQQMVNRWNLTVMWSCIIGSNHNSFQDGICVEILKKSRPQKSFKSIGTATVYIYICLHTCIQLYTDIHMYIYIYMYLDNRV